jgi:hypothetical protein
MAIFSLNRSFIDRTTHAPGAASLFARYITRNEGRTETIGQRMPTEAGPLTRWLDEEERGDRKNTHVIDNLIVALPMELSHEEISRFLSPAPASRWWRKSLTRLNPSLIDRIKDERDMSMAEKEQAQQVRNEIEQRNAEADNQKWRKAELRCSISAQRSRGSSVDHFMSGHRLKAIVPHSQI